MDDDLKEKLRKLNEATDAKVSQQREQNARTEAASRQTAQNVKERQQAICNAAERLSNNWLKKAADEFKELVPFYFRDTRQEPFDGMVKDLPWKHVRMSNFKNLGDATLVALIRIESEEAVKVEVQFEVGGRLNNYAEEVFPLIGNFNLQDEAAVTKWMLNALVEGYDRMRQAAAGVAST